MVFGRFQLSGVIERLNQPINRIHYHIDINNNTADSTSASQLGINRFPCDTTDRGWYLVSDRILERDFNATSRGDCNCPWNVTENGGKADKSRYIRGHFEISKQPLKRRYWHYKKAPLNISRGLLILPFIKRENSTLTMLSKIYIYKRSTR